MAKITLLHTVASVYNSFKGQLEAKLGKDHIVNSMVDEFLVTRAQKLGYFAPECKQKLYLDLLSAQAENPDVIVVTCSSLTPFVEELTSSFALPIVCIDNMMCKNAAANGSKIAVFATAPTTVDPTVNRIQREADALGKDVEINSFLDTEAMTLLKSGDVAGHDERLKNLASSISGFDVIVLAQASMATALDGVKSVNDALVLTSPGACLDEVKSILEAK